MLEAETEDRQPAGNEDQSVVPIDFGDDRFRKFGRFLFGEIDGVKLGAALATYSPGFGNYALNKADLDRLLAGKAAGKVDRAFVVAARKGSNGGAYEYGGQFDAEEVHAKLKDERPESGKYGDFYVLPPGFATTGNVDFRYEPF